MPTSPAISPRRSPTTTSTTSIGRMRIRVGASERTLWMVRLLFRTSLYLLAAVASSMLAIAEGSMLPVVLTIPLAIVAFVVTGHPRGVHLPNALANVAGALALIACYMEFREGSQEARLLAGAHLLVYLTWIVLFQKKSMGTYWWICALSVLQVAVGSLLLQTSAYGVYLLGYAFLAVWTLSVFSVFRAYLPDDAEPDDLPLISDATVSTVTASPFADVRPASRTIGYVHLDERPGVLGLRFVTGVVGTTLSALAVSFLVFLLFPRLWIGQQAFPGTTSESDGAIAAMTGISETVQLGSMGPILESNERVLEVQMIDEASGETLDVEAFATRLGYEEPLFRGRVFDHYEAGEWTPLRWPLTGPPLAVRRDGMIRQVVRMKPQATPVLFVMQPAADTEVLFDARSESAYRHPFTTEFLYRPIRGRETVEYAAQTYPTANRGQIRDVQLSMRDRLYLLNQLVQPTDLDRIERFVAAERTALERDETTPAEVAARLEARLRDSGDYTYSLAGSTVPRGVDPVEYFLFTTRSGHCEYYAAALVLMLRECGIPARYVVGFKGGTPNAFTGYFDVEQRHAHAWVEAYITDRRVDLVDVAPRFGSDLRRWIPPRDEENLRTGRWAVLDATPALERNASVESQARSVRSLADLQLYLSDQWDWYVLRMNSLKQYDQFYKPFEDFGSDAWNSLRGDGESRRALRERLARIWNSPEDWFSPVGFVATFVVLTLLLGLVRVTWMIVRWLWRRGLGEDVEAGRRRRVQVAFYERFAAACRRLGLERGPSQTQREFAARVTEHLAGLAVYPDSPNVPATTLPEELVRDFYDVRFGDTPLPPARLAELERRLVAFEAAVSAPAASPSFGSA